MTLGKRLKQVREKRLQGVKNERYSQRAIEMRTGMQLGHLSKLETDFYKTMQVDTLVKLARDYKLTEKELLWILDY